MSEAIPRLSFSDWVLASSSIVCLVAAAVGLANSSLTTALVSGSIGTAGSSALFHSLRARKTEDSLVQSTVARPLLFCSMLSLLAAAGLVILSFYRLDVARLMLLLTAVLFVVLAALLLSMWRGVR